MYKFHEIIPLITQYTYYQYRYVPPEVIVVVVVFVNSVTFLWFDGVFVGLDFFVCWNPLPLPLGVNATDGLFFVIDVTFPFVGVLVAPGP